MLEYNKTMSDDVDSVVGAIKKASHLSNFGGPLLSGQHIGVGISDGTGAGWLCRFKTDRPGKYVVRM
ncbi:hypothetical protein [Chitinophaga sp.]|uniref:hypothetical protein n=1 Tax=Chitinophaga sp. TaxID=1869181 RepID=UPI0031D3EA60